MRAFALATALVGAVALAAPASAATAQCYDSYGRPMGPTFDTNYVNPAFTQYVQRNGGTCYILTPGAGQNATPPSQGQNHGYRHNDDPAAGHSAWCGTNPPSGYCITREGR